MTQFSPSPPSLARGIASLNGALQAIPGTPGVYKMLGQNGDILYIGKAKNLQKRVSTYRLTDRLPYRIQHMVSLVFDVLIHTTNTESEALLLEANLIKEHQPHFNILLKDDKSFPYLLLSTDHPFPRISKHRIKYQEKQPKNARVYGPFANVFAVNQAIIDLQKAFLVRPCTDSFFAGRKRPCMEYQIKRCSGPCTNKISKEEYDNLVQQLISFLDGKSRDIQENLSEKMQEASEGMQYEQAGFYRDRIKALNHIQAKQTIHTNHLKDADVVGFYRHDNDPMICIEISFFRNHQHFGSRAYFLTLENEEDNGQIIETFLSQFYQNHPIPPFILLSQKPTSADVIQKALNSLAQKQIHLLIPKKGPNLLLVNATSQRAEASLRQHRIKQMKYQFVLKELADIFNLSTPPKRIEIYDNSHISGTNRVGAMVVATPEGLLKSAYRTFTIKQTNINAGDDYAMMREVLTRRLTRLLKEHPIKTPGIWPDLLLIDGGAGQLSSALEILDQLNLTDRINVVGIAKGKDRNAGKERFFLPHREAFSLPYQSPILHYLQTLRDEAHRYAITAHRKKRSNALTHSTLDDIPSIGKARKQTLLKHFGSVEALIGAAETDIAKVSGINKKTAQIIYRFFHPS